MSSSGGATGVTSEYIRDAQDFTLQLKRRHLVGGYHQNLLSHIPNSTGDYLSYLIGSRGCMPVLDITPPSISHPEGDSGPTIYTYTVTRSNPSLSSSVDWAVGGSGGDQAIPLDFGGAFPAGTLNFAVGDLTLVIQLEVYGNQDPQPDREFTVTLSNPKCATIGVGTAIGIIANDD